MMDNNHISSPYGSSSLLPPNHQYMMEQDEHFNALSSIPSSYTSKFTQQSIIHNHVNHSSPGSQHARTYPPHVNSNSTSPVQGLENSYNNHMVYNNHNHHSPLPRHDSYPSSPPISPHHHHHHSDVDQLNNHSMDPVNSQTNSYHSIYNSTAPSYQPNQYGQLMEQLGVLKADNENLRKEVKLKDSKLAATVNSIKTFWSPELKKESMIKREEVEKSELLKDRFKMIMEESQVRSILCLLIYMSIIHLSIFIHL